MSKKTRPVHLDDGNTAPSVKSGRILDFIAKILCLLGAFLIWFYAMSTDVVTLEKEFTVPIDIENEDVLFDRTGWSVLSGRDNKIVVTLKGKRNVVSNLAESDIYAYVDVSSVESAGRQTLDVVVSAPSECEVVNTSTSSLSPYIDKRMTKNVPIEVSIPDYQISSEYQLDTPITNIKEVSITGPESELRRVSAARAVLSLGNVTQSVIASSRLELVDDSKNTVTSSYISMAVSSVNITVKLFATKEVPLKVSYKYGYFNEKNVKISISPSTVTLRGEPAALENINSIDIATVDEKMFAKNGTQSVSITLPEGVTKMGADQSAVISVEHIGTNMKSVSVENIKPANMSGLDCILETKSVNVSLRGPSSLLSKITEDDITVLVDLRTYTPGSGLTVVPATIQISDEYKGSVYELGSYSVTVNIK